MPDQPHRPKKIIDVAPPGNVAADPSGKPVIVSNKPSHPDPMVAKPAATEETKVEVRKTPVPEVSPAAKKLDGDLESVSQEVDNDISQERQLKQAAIVVKPPTPLAEWTKRVGLLLLSVILVLAVVDLLLDAGLIKSDIRPLTHFFHHQ